MAESKVILAALYISVNQVSCGEGLVVLDSVRLKTVVRALRKRSQNNCLSIGYSSFDCRNAPACVRYGCDHFMQAYSVLENHTYYVKCGDPLVANNWRCPTYKQKT